MESAFCARDVCPARINFNMGRLREELRELISESQMNDHLKPNTDLETWRRDYDKFIENNRVLNAHTDGELQATDHDLRIKSRCNVCLSQTHKVGKCAVAGGISQQNGESIPPDVGIEIMRLHKLHMMGEYDPYNTPTTLCKIQKARIELKNIRDRQHLSPETVNERGVRVVEAHRTSIRVPSYSSDETDERLRSKSEVQSFDNTTRPMSTKMKRTREIIKRSFQRR